MNMYSYNPRVHPNFMNEQNFDQLSGCADASGFQQPPFDYTEVPEIPDTCFNYITNLLRENDSEDRPGVTLDDYMAAQVEFYGRSLGEIIQTPSFPSYDCFDDYVDNAVNVSNSGNVPNGGVVYQNSLVGNGHYVGCNITDSHFNLVPSDVIYEEPPFGFVSGENWGLDQSVINNTVENGQIQGFETLTDVIEGNMNLIFSNNTLVENQIPEIGLLEPRFCNVIGQVECNDTTEKTRGRKFNEVDNQGNGDENGGANGSRNKQVALSNDWCDQIEKYGDVLLCPEGRSKPAALCGKSKLQNSDGDKDKKRGSNKGKKVVDLRSLLTRCAQCVARVDLTGAYELLKQIREHASPYGDFLQRVAHYLANGLEARLEGKGSELTRENEHLSPFDILKANRVFVGSVPFKIMSYYTTNKTIASLAMEASSIHIIDFGIYYGLQWPCIIQNLSKRPNGPPKIRITGIDFPQPGFHPSERVEETGRCLAKYCEKYNVPFEYNSIAQQWDTIKLSDLKIIPNEPLVVNCLYRSHSLFDESIDDNSPRDEFLRLVRKINPNIFMHGVVNSTCSVPFFLNRFKETMFHYSALFDVFESTMSREDEERRLLESKVYGNQALNVIACEGVERVERYESYKQWQVRTQRVGFEQVAMDRDLVRRARAMVKRSFRDEFSYDEDGCWVVQGWKGRILYAISCWKPV